MKSSIQIDPEKYYAATTIIRNGWFPWIRSQMTIMKMLKEPAAREIYRPVMRFAGKQIRYNIKGSTILDIIKRAEEGRLEI